MKTITTLMMLTLATASTAAMANEKYNCDSLDINSAQELEGAYYSVTLHKGGGAEVFSVPVVRNPKPEKNYDLNMWTPNGLIFTTTDYQDLSVNFTLSYDRKAGVLQIQSMMPQRDGSVAPGRAFICTK